MDLPNLAAVLAPSLIYAKGSEQAPSAQLMENRIVQLLFEYQDDFLTVPNEMIPMLHDQEYFASCVEMPAKEALKKFETYMRLKQGQGRGQVTPNGGIPINGAGPSDGRAVHAQRSDPMMRGRPTPPFVSEDSRQQSGIRSPRSQSRGPAPSSSHGHTSAQGHGSPGNMPENGWAPGSPPANRPGPPMQQLSTPNTRNARLPPEDGLQFPQQQQPWTQAPWESPVNSRPGSPRGSSHGHDSRQ